MYTVKYEKQAVKQLKKMDKFQAKIITDWVKKNLVGTENPRLHGKGLNDENLGQWRYRIGNYRILAEISDNEILIRVLSIGHRRLIYGKN